jgi:hypothetical protein
MKPTRKTEWLEILLATALGFLRRTRCLALTVLPELFFKIRRLTPGRQLLARSQQLEAGVFVILRCVF